MKMISNRVYAPGIDGKILPFDRWLLLSVAVLLMTGLLMIISASMDVAQENYNNPFHFAFRQTANLIVALLVSVFVLSRPISFWQKNATILLLVGVVLLIAVLIPGIGRKINGSYRWLNLGVANFQPSELARFALVVYISSYLTRYIVQVRNSWGGVVKPLLPLLLVGVLLYSEPDYGSLVVLTCTILGMIFLSGMNLRHLLPVLAVIVLVMVYLVLQESYRLSRLEAFRNPWDDPYGIGYQLTQAQIAFGRGEWFGTGLGNSVQKLFFLPEAHTDFVFSVFAEEFGFIGAIFLILTYCTMIARIFIIGRFAETKHRLFPAFYCYGVGLMLAGQALINIGVNVGALPTKGLTLPLVSYGGSSLIMSCVLLAVVFKVDYEQRKYLVELGQSHPKSKTTGEKG